MKRPDIDHAAQTVINIASTRYGKTISITRGRFGRMFEITVDGGGTKPPMLSGMYTEYAKAYQAILAYVYEARDYQEGQPLLKRPKVAMNTTPLDRAA